MEDFSVELDLKQKPIKNFSLENLSVPPANPVSGQHYFDTTLKRTRSFNGVEWDDNVILPATDTILGGVIKGNNVNIAVDGTLTIPTIDDLTNTSVIIPLSANQGYILNNRLNTAEGDITNLNASVAHNKGYFADPNALITAYPIGVNGDYAIVGTTDTQWIWDGRTGTWVDTGTHGSVKSVNTLTGDVVLNSDNIIYTTKNISMTTQNDLINFHMPTKISMSMGDGVNTVFQVGNPSNPVTTDMTVTVLDKFSGNVFVPEINITLNEITITISTSPPPALNQYRATFFY